MRAVAAIPVVLLAAGVALIALAVAEGGATVGLFVVFPFVVGSSLGFLLGVVLLVLGFLTLPLAFAPLEEEEPGAPPAGVPSAAPEGGSWGGLVLVGPVPFFFGRWKNASTLTWVLAVAFGVALVVVVALILALFAR